MERPFLKKKKLVRPLIIYSLYLVEWLERLGYGAENRRKV